MTSTTSARLPRPRQLLVLVAAAALLLVGGAPASAAPTTGRTAHAPATQTVRHPAASVLQVTPQPPQLVRGVRAGARSGLRWLAIVLPLLLAAVALRRRALRAVLPFVRSVATRDLVRRRGPPSFAPC